MLAATRACFEERNFLVGNKDFKVVNGGIGYEDYFAVLRNNYTDGEAMGQSIDFFGWDGKPLTTVNLPADMIFRKFDIDRRDSSIYCLDGDNDCIVRFQVALPPGGKSVAPRSTYTLQHRLHRNPRSVM